MQKRFILAMLGLGVVYLVTAQQQSPEVISPAGGIDRTETISLEWTAGELATETIYTSSSMISQGFHQPVLRVVKQQEDNLVEANDLFQVFPNPVESILEVKLPIMELPETVEMRLLDLEGQLILSLSVEPHQRSQQIDMSTFSSGTYVLQCNRKSSSKMTSFKIIKS